VQQNFWTTNILTGSVNVNGFLTFFFPNSVKNRALTLFPPAPLWNLAGMYMFNKWVLYPISWGGKFVISKEMELISLSSAL
jgi:hypothetical protein